MASGIVYLVGAGPGDPELVTVKGLHCIRRADVLAYDRLVSPALVAQSRPDAEKVYVGKEAGYHSLPQADINRLLADRALEGKVVCRLKGGDPFVFGRGGEEAEALAELGVPFEVVPGVTSGIAAPAFAGIPVTHRDLAGSVVLVTGHDAPSGEGPGVDWSQLAGGGSTLLIYMGVGTIARTAEQLMQHGRSPETPVAVIRWGTRPEQMTVTGTLREIAGEVERVGVRPPALIVVGEVAALRERLAWAERKPLFGQRVLIPVTGETSPLAWPLRQAGAEVWEWPVGRRYLPRTDTGELLREALAEGAIQAVVLESPLTADLLVRALGGAEALDGVRLFTCDGATARQADQAGLHVAGVVPTGGELTAALLHPALLR